MPKVVQKTLTFPMAGVSRSRNYRDQERPYASPWAANVRGVGALESRRRGGSRPGLVKVYATDFGSAITAVAPVTSVSSAGVRTNDMVVIVDGVFKYLRGSAVTATTSELLDENGVAILTEDGDTIVFDSSVSSAGPIGTGVFSTAERNGRLLVADAGLKEYDPQTGVLSVLTATTGTIPTTCTLIAVYRDRVFLAGSDHVWYCCRQSDILDWNFGANSSDAGRAVAGEISGAGSIGEVITAMIPNGQSSLLFASKNGLWLLRDDPTYGAMLKVSHEIGIISPTAWAMSHDGTVAFLSGDGVYLTSPGQAEHPVRFSEERIPDQLRGIDTAANTVTMAWDATARGFHLFITPTPTELAPNNLGQHWWFDLVNKAMWPVVLPAAMQPVAVARLQGTTGLSEVVLGCRDGYLRKFSSAATTDDGTAIQSHVLLGPFSMASGDMTDAVLAEIHGILADNSGTVTWRVVMGPTAEYVADMAVAGITSALAGTTISGVADSGSWSEDRNKVVRPRARGPWCVIWLSAATPWEFEAVAVRINQLGRMR